MTDEKSTITCVATGQRDGSPQHLTLITGVSKATDWLTLQTTIAPQHLTLIMSKKSPWSNNGGARKNAGRKPKPDAKVNVPLRMRPDVVSWIRSLENQSEGVEAVLRRCKDFREWSRQQGK